MSSSRRGHVMQARSRAAAMAMLLLASSPKVKADGPDAIAPPDGSSSSSSSRNETEYNAFIKRALVEYELGHWTEAKAFFQRAHQLRPSARTLRGLGLASYELRGYVEALTYLRQALASQEKPLTEEMRAAVKSTIEEAKSFIAYNKLALEPHDVRVRVDGQPATFDDDGSLLLDPGQHEIELESTGFEPLTRSVVAKGGERSELQLTLRARPAEPKPAAVESHPTATEVSFWRSLTTQHRIGLALGLGGVVALGLGTTFSILALNEVSASKDHCIKDLCDATGIAQRKSAMGSADAATASFIIGAALLAGGAAVYLTAPPRKPSTIGLNLTPVIGPGVAGVLAQGRWQ